MEAPPAPPGLPPPQRRKKWRPHAAVRAKYAAANRWLSGRPVTCAVAAATDLAAGDSGETKRLYSEWKSETGSGRAVSYPVFQRALAALLSQPRDAKATRPKANVWKPTIDDHCGGHATAEPGTSSWTSRASPVKSALPDAAGSSEKTGL